jgi:hypothetical protein
MDANNNQFDGWNMQKQRFSLSLSLSMLESSENLSLLKKPGT